MRDKIEILIQTTDNYMLTGAAWTDSLSVHEATFLGCLTLHKDPTATLALTGEYTVVATAGGPRVCLTYAKIHNGETTLTLTHHNCDLDMLLDDIQLTEGQHSWAQDLTEATNDEGDR